MNHTANESARRHLSQFAGYPIYFFDTNYLSRVPNARAARDDAALAESIKTALSAALLPLDVKIGGDGGFYLVFTNRTSGMGADRAHAICAALSQALGLSLNAEKTDRFCRPVSLSDLAAALGLAQNDDAGASASPPSAEGDEFADELGALFVDRLLSSADDNESALYSPIWDCRKARITVFALGLDAASKRRMEKPRAAADALVLAAAQSKLDIAILAWAVGAARRLISQNKVALISMPLHVETLSWSKTRNAYLNVLAQIDPRIISLIAPRIIGFDAGSNLNQVGQWTQALHRHCVFVHLPNTNFDFSGAGNLGATVFALTAHSSRVALGEEASRLTRLSSDQNAIPYMDNVKSTAELSILKRKGIRLASGPLIGLPATLSECLRAEAWEKPQLAVSA